MRSAADTPEGVSDAAMDGASPIERKENFMSTSTKQRPALRAVVNTGSREAPVYQEVGAAWPHKKGFTLRLKDPSGKVTDVILFTVTPKPAKAGAEAA